MFNQFLEDAVATISRHHSFNELLSSSIFSLKSVKSPNSVEDIVSVVSKSVLSCSVGGVDSGFVSKRLSFIDLVLVKTTGVVFGYENGAQKEAVYYPAPFSFPEPILLRQGLEADEELQSVSLIRLRKEVECSIDVIRKYKPKFLFIDGSIVPQYQDKPRKESGLSEDYHSIISLFQKLYKTAEDNSTILIACVEDSRGTRFRQILQDVIIPNNPLISKKVSPAHLNGSFDASLLDYYLRAGERTFSFSYSDAIDSHAILKDYSPEWSKSIFVFYIKATEFDKPLRVEFLCKGADRNPLILKKCADVVAGVVFALSSIHKEYSFPSILIEADLRAGLSEQEISVVYDRLVDRLGSKIRMRRNARPFG